MPYDADLRASYFFVSLNMSWFYEAMSEQDITFDFLPTYYRALAIQEDEKEKKDATNTTIAMFEHHIEDAFKDWAVYKVIGHKKGDHNYDIHDSVWEFLHDVAIDYTRTHKNVKMIFGDLEEEEQEPGSPYGSLTPETAHNIVLGYLTNP